MQRGPRVYTEFTFSSALQHPKLRAVPSVARSSPRGLRRTTPSYSFVYFGA